VVITENSRSQYNLDCIFRYESGVFT